MVNSSNQAMYSSLKTLAQCYSTGNFEPILGLLSDDVTLSSMWVLETLSGYEKVKEYFVEKGKTIKEYGCFPVCSIVRSTAYPQGKLLIYMCQYLGDETAEGIIDVNFDVEGKIKQINLCDKTLYQFEFADRKVEAEAWADWFREQSIKMRESGNAFLSQQMRRRRKEIYQQTMKLIELGSYESVENNRIQFPDAGIMTKSTVFYYEEIHMDKRPSYDSMEISVQNIDCVLAGKQLKDAGYHPAILNMANGHNPGGGVLSGAGAQEENLFRRSNLFKSLYQFADYAPLYGLQKSEYQYPLDFHFGGIYTPDAFFFRGLEADGYPLLDDPYCLSVISVPAINIRGHELSIDEYMATTKDKIRTILRIGMQHQHDALVLSAFGCGAFGNDPYVMAALFKEIFCEPEFIYSFRKVVFAIVDDHNSNGNYAAFNEIIH